MRAGRWQAVPCCTSAFCPRLSRQARHLFRWVWVSKDPLAPSCLPAGASREAHYGLTRITSPSSASIHARPISASIHFLYNAYGGYCPHGSAWRTRLHQPTYPFRIFLADIKKPFRLIPVCRHRPEFLRWDAAQRALSVSADAAHNASKKEAPQAGPCNPMPKHRRRHEPYGGRLHVARAYNYPTEPGRGEGSSRLSYGIQRLKSSTTCRNDRMAIRTRGNHATHHIAARSGRRNHNTS